MPKQLTLSDALLFNKPNRKRSKAHPLLMSISEMIDWGKIETLFHQRINAKPQTNKGGRPSIALSIKIKMLFLQGLYNMSDERLEDSLLDNFSYQEFVGLSLSEDAPDFTTFWRFKEELAKRRLSEVVLWNAVESQLSEKGVRIKKGQMAIIDATMLTSHNKPLSKDEMRQSATTAFPPNRHGCQKHDEKWKAALLWL